jgi:(heptosyl)LPS beta-1,4-glucosyltransferase
MATLKKVPLSVIVLTKNEEANLPDCLKSLDWAAQLIVVDSQSTDRTLELAKKYGAETYNRPWPGYTAQRNFALSKCRQPWVLSVDADERVAPDLRAAIETTIRETPDRDGYRVPEVNNYFGRWLRHGGIYPGEHMVFYRREGAKYESGRADVHEGVQVSNPGRLNGHLIHFAYPSIELALSLEAFGAIC